MKKSAYNTLLRLACLIFLMSGLTVSKSFAQCWVSLIADSAYSDSVEICRGDTVILSAEGECTQINGIFNNGLTGLWDYCTPNVMFESPCDTNEVNPYCLWFGPDAGPTRILSTVDLDLTNGCEVKFDLLFGVQNDPIPCEGPDEMKEGVSFQYSTDQGATWIDIAYFCPDGTILPTNPNTQFPLTNTPTIFTTWGTYSFPIPLAAQIHHCRFRWFQEYMSTYNGHYYDSWGLNNIKISHPIEQSIHWSFGSTVLNPPGVSPLNTTYYYVYLIDNIFSGDTLARDSIKVIVHLPPVFTYTGVQEICLGDTSQIICDLSYNYQWSNGLNGSLFQVAPQQTTTYQVTVSDNIGCFSLDTIGLIVKPLPDAVALGTSVCRGQTATLSAAGGGSYQWSNGMQGPSIQVVPTVTTTYIVTVTGNNGCSDTASALIRVENSPDPGLADEISICYGESAVLLASGGVYYNWNTGQNKPGIEVWPGTNTYFVVTVTDLLGCYSLDSVLVKVSPDFQVRILADVDTICAGTSLILHASGGESYLWNSGGHGSDILVEPRSNSTFTVTATNTFNNIVCSQTKDIDIYVKDCNNFVMPNAFSPKGYNNIFKPVGEFPTSDGYSFFIYDRWGKQVFYTVNVSEGWDGYYNGSLVEPGIYIYVVRFESSPVNEPFEKKGSVLVLY